MGKKIYRKKGGDGREYVAEITNDGRITAPDGMFTHKTVGWLVGDSLYVPDGSGRRKALVISRSQGAATGMRLYRETGMFSSELVAEIAEDGRITIPDGMFTDKTVGWLVDDSPLPPPSLELTDPDLPWTLILLLALFGVIIIYGALQLAWGNSSLGAFSGKDIGMLIIGLTAVATCAVSSLVIFRRARHGEVSGIAAIAQTVARAYYFPVGGVTAFFVIGAVMGREPLMVLLIPISIVPYMVALCLPFFAVETLVLWIVSRCVQAKQRSKQALNLYSFIIRS